MIAALVLASFPYLIVAIPQEWSWDEVPNATAYRIYYGDRIGRCCGFVAIAPNCTAGRCVGDLPEETEFAWISVTATNAYGESPDRPTVEVCS